MTPASPIPEDLAMRCMEIRGGSGAVEENLSTPGLDVWVYSRPYAGAVNGGDTYYVSLCGGGVITRLIVADVSGHGARVAAFSAALRGLMRKNINTKSQTRLVRELNRQFGAHVQLERFATAVVATYLANDRSLTVCNAGHPRPLWYRAASRRWSWLDHIEAEAGNLPLGLDDETTYNQFAVTLGDGDVVLFYTDALTEATDGSGRLLGEDGLIEMARSLEMSDPRRIGRALLDGVDRHRGDRPDDDDVTLVSLVHDASGPRWRSVGERLEVYAKVFGLKDF
jgi:sigma-B regulation protein RsbU (phosphoserine phosphatase)